MNDDEILAVIAHEFGHIKANHVLYKTATRILSSLAEGIAQKTLGLGGLMLYPLSIALLRWDRASELSSDRAALLVVKIPTAEHPHETSRRHSAPTRAQYQSLYRASRKNEKMQDEGPLGTYIAVMNSMFTTHPFPIWRAREIIDWVKSGEYLSILQGRYQRSKALPLESASNEASQEGTELDKKVKTFQQWLKKSLS